MLEVARQADVAPGTVLNHFGTTDALAEAVLERVFASVDVPTPRIFAGTRSRRDRIRRLVAEMFAFYGRSNPWYELFRAELETVPAGTYRRAATLRSLGFLWVFELT
jgi:AcrR family transcriptional regulator